MNKTFSLLVALGTMLMLGGCMDSYDSPNTQELRITAQHLNEANIGLLAVKQKYETPITGNNTFEQIKDEDIFEGVVVGNDISGNLYQTLVLRQIGSTPGAPDDQCITLGVKHTILYPYFPLGQKVRVKLKGLYIGNYSRTPKIGAPYYTSSGNLRLGPMLMEQVSTHLMLVGTPNPKAPELQPLDLTTPEGEAWLANRDNKNFLHAPLLATVKGLIKENQGKEQKQAATGALSNKTEPLPKIFAPEALYDAGFAVDRTLLLSKGGQLTLRTSTQNEIAFLPLPQDERRYTGILSYYSDWQLQLRSAQDIQPNIQ